jgi:hypothetical protein
MAPTLVGLYSLVSVTLNSFSVPVPEREKGPFAHAI